MKQNKPKLDFIKLRQEEIEYARKKAEYEQANLEHKEVQEKLPLSKKELFRNLMLTILIIIVVIVLLVGAYFIGKTD